MRKMNCRNIRREIEEAGPGDLLNSAVNTHLTTCVDCESFARDQIKLQQIVSSLGTVEAPGDFDFRLRARLAGEKRQPGRPFARASFSFGLGSAAMAMLLILAGAAILFISLKTRSGNSVPEVVAVIPQGKTTANPGDPSVATPQTRVVAGPNTSPAAVVKGNDNLSAGTPAKRHGLGRSAVASAGGNPQAIRDSSSRGARVVSADQVAGTYPFPIEASYQSLKVSVDDGRGSSRTISLPTVSFGSQRALPQNSSPLMASARGDW